MRKVKDIVFPYITRGRIKKRIFFEHLALFPGGMKRMMRKKDPISGKTRESLTRSTPKTPKTTTTVGMQDVKRLTNAPNNNRGIILGRGSGRRRST